MAADILILLLKANLAAGAAILIVAVLRKPVRAVLGARLAYGLWLLPLLAMAGALAPARRVVVRLPPALPAAPGAPAPLDAGAAPEVAAQATLPVDPSLWLLALWIAGALVAVAVMVRLQCRFAADARRGEIGPAVVGVVRPRIITPSDFAEKFDAEQQALVLAHEQAHLDREDSRLNGLAAALQCLFWFNPLIHLGSHLMRIDQEMACDETVVTRFPDARRAYADALVKAQLAIRPLPLGCYWPSGTEHPLLERIAMLNHEDFSRARRNAGAAALVVLCLGTAVGAWAAQPAKLRIIPARLTAALAPAALHAPLGELEAPEAVAAGEVSEAGPEAVEATAADAAPEAPAAVEPQAPPGPQAPILALNPPIDLTKPEIVEGTLTRVAWVNPSVTLYIRDASGAEVPVGTTTPNALLRAGGSREVLQMGMTITARGYRTPGGNVLFADPYEFTSNGQRLFANAETPEARAVRLAGAAQRDKVCGTAPVPGPGSAPADMQAVMARLQAWQADCDAKMSAANGPGKAAIITNSVAR